MWNILDSYHNSQPKISRGDHVELKVHFLLLIRIIVSYHYIGWIVITFKGQGVCWIVCHWLTFKNNHTFFGQPFKNPCIFHSGKPKVKSYKPSHTCLLSQWALGLQLVWLMTKRGTKVSTNFKLLWRSYLTFELPINSD